VTQTFGSMQLVEYIHQVQGAITSITSVEIELNLIISGEAQNVMLTQLEAITNLLFLPIINMTEAVKGHIISSEEELKVPFSYDIDVTVTQMYTLFWFAVGETLIREQECVGSQFFEFTFTNLSDYQ
jgi:hypothetical protein